MKYRLIKDLPDAPKGMIFEAADEGRLYVSKYKDKLYVYTDAEIKNKAYFKPVKEIEDKLIMPEDTIGKSE